MKFYPMHMHLHASHEPTASIGAHMSHASALGIKHLWLTEHDVRMGEKARSLPHYTLPAAELISTLDNGIVAGFRELVTSGGGHSFSEEEGLVTLTLTSLGGEERLRFFTKGKNHSDQLFSGVSVGLEAEISLSEGAEFALEFVLSCQPPSYEHARMVYILGDVPENKENIQYLPFPEMSEDGSYLFNLTKDADECVGGLDNSSCYIELVLRGCGSVKFKGFRFERELNYEPVRQNQIKLAQKLGKKWGVTPFVTFEITGAGHHKNCYTTTVPCIDYKAHGFKVTQAEAIEHVKAHGGIFCYNHPFTEWKNAKLSEEEKWELIDKLANEFAENRVFGATLMEVGFPYEKEDFYDRHYLALWDKLSSRGIFITGDGDSDNHDATEDGWSTGNNFATFTGIYDSEEPSEKSFRDAFRRGTVWCGDPTQVYEMNLTLDEKCAMGAIFTDDVLDLAFSARTCMKSGKLIRIVDGSPEYECDIEDGICRDSFTLQSKNDVSFARYELRDSEGVLKGLTNPVYLVKDKNKVYNDAEVRLAK